jgi:predicted ATPase
LVYRSWALWMLGYPDAALADADHAVSNAREIDQAATLMFALCNVSFVHTLCGNYPAADDLATELTDFADEKSAVAWKAGGMLDHGYVLLLTGKAADAVDTITSGRTALQSMGSALIQSVYLTYLGMAYAELGKMDHAWRCIGETMTAVDTTNERLFEVEVNRIAGEIALKSPEHYPAKAQTYFERALGVARQQQAKSWELRAAMSMARLWRDQGKRDEARDLLAPVYGWFTEGFDTLDLKEAKALLDELKA